MEISQRNSVIVHSSQFQEASISPVAAKQTKLANEINGVLKKTEVVLDQVVTRLGTFHSLDAEIKNVYEKLTIYNAIRRSQRFTESPYIVKLRMIHRLVEIQEQVQLLSEFVKEFTLKMCQIYPVFERFLHEIRDQMDVLKSLLLATDASKSLQDLEKVTVPAFELSQDIPHMETEALLQEWEKMQVHKRVSYFLQQLQDMFHCVPAPELTL